MVSPASSGRSAGLPAATRRPSARADRSRGRVGRADGEAVHRGARERRQVADGADRLGQHPPVRPLDRDPLGLQAASTCSRTRRCASSTVIGSRHAAESTAAQPAGAGTAERPSARQPCAPVLLDRRERNRPHRVPGHEPRRRQTSRIPAPEPSRARPRHASQEQPEEGDRGEASDERGCGMLGDAEARDRRAGSNDGLLPRLRERGPNERSQSHP